MRTGTPGFVGERLVEAREARGLSAVALADLLKVKSANITQYEHARQSPSPEVMERIVEVLGKPRAFFMRPAQADADDPTFFRSLSSATKASRSRATRRFAWVKELKRYEADYLDFPKVNIPSFDLPKDPTKITSRMVEQVAGDCRRFWNLGDGPIADIVLVLENNGVIASRWELGAETLDAFSQWNSKDGTPYVVLGADKGSACRSRFDAAHELGHLVLHRHIDRRQINTPQIHKVLETQSHRFAGAFILPAERFAGELWGPTLDSFYAMKESWGAAIALMIKRCEDLHILSGWEARRAWINLTRRKWRTEEPLDDQLHPELPRLLRRGIEALVDNGIKSKGQVLLDLATTARDVEEVANLPAGYLSEEDQLAPRLKQSVRAEVIPFNSQR